jgi:hypothetical protein
MTQIDKTTITVGKGLLVVISISQAIITYMASQFGTQAAIKALQYETQIQINELKYEDKLIWNRVNMIASNTYRHEAVKPEEVKPKEEE